MVLARWQANIVDNTGAPVTDAQVEVKFEATGFPTGIIFSDRAGATPKLNPFPVNPTDGHAFFHAPGGSYRVRAFNGSGYEKIWRYVPIGLGAESDLSFSNPRGAWDIATVYQTGDYVKHGDYLFISREDENVGNEPDETTPGDTAEWMFAGGAVTGPQGEQGQAFFPDAIGVFTDRATYNAETEPFAFLSTDGDGSSITDPVIFFKTGPGSGDWSAAVPFYTGNAEILLYGIKGTDIPSANSLDLGAADGDFVHITGATTINTLGIAPAGAIRTVRFMGALQLTHGGASIILPGAANITTAANDVAIFRSLGGNVWLAISYQRANGRPVSTAVAMLDVEDQAISGGAIVTSKALGTAGIVTGGTVTINVGARAFQHYENRAAHILSPGANVGSCVVEIVNGTGAGAVTLTGWTHIQGAFTTTVGHKFHVSVVRSPLYSSITIRALQ